MNLDRISQSFKEGWECLRKHPAELFAGFAFFAGIMALMALFNMIPGLWVLVMIFVAAPLKGGLLILNMKALRDEKPAIPDVFAGFQRYVPLLLAGLIFFAVMFVAAMPGLGLIILGKLFGSTSMVNIGQSFSILLAIVAVLAFASRFFFAFFIVADGLYGDDVIAAYRRSFEMTRMPVTLEVLLAMVVFVVVAYVGLCFCGIGVLATGPVAVCAATAYYLKFRIDEAEPAEAVELEPYTPIPDAAPEFTG